MKIAFFTENRFNGKIKLPNNNLRTDLAWIYLLDATNIYINDLPNVNIPNDHYDLGIIILPKNRVDIYINIIQKICKKTTIMQEGPSNYWEDYGLAEQFKYLELLHKVDFLLCHNISDIPYYEGLTESKRIYTMQSVMVEESIKDLKPDLKSRSHSLGNIIIGGNMCSWYGGMKSYIVGRKIHRKISAPSMGRKISGEEQIEGLEHLPYMNWSEWMNTLNKYSIGVHLMPTVAAGTFSLNCSYLGIPCIGNEKLDTQLSLHKKLSIDVNDISRAILCIKALTTQETYYSLSDETQEDYHEKYHSRIYKQKMNEIFEKENLL